MIATLTVSVEIPDRMIAVPSTKEYELFPKMLSDMEEIVAKEGYSLDDSNWEVQNG